MNNLIIFGAEYLIFFEMAILVIYFFLQTKNKREDLFIFSALLFFLAYIAAKTISLFYFDPRPFAAGNFTPLITHAPDNGFPSDHMLIAGATASIIFAYNKKLGLFAWLLAFIIGASRVFAGVHHWIDIVGSIIIVLGANWFVKNRIMPRLAKNKK